MKLALITKELEQIEETEKKTEPEIEPETEPEPEPEPVKKKLSQDQIELVKNYISNTEEAMNALKEIINPEKSITPLKDKKGRKPFVKSKSKKSDMERLLIMFDKMCETLLRELRQPNAKENQK